MYVSKVYCEVICDGDCSKCDIFCPINPKNDKCDMTK